MSETKTTSTAESLNIRPVSTGSNQPASTKTVVTNIKKRKKRNRIVIIVGAILLLTIGILAALNGGKEKPIVVQTEKVSKRTITEIVQATGKIQPEIKVKISPEVSGEIVELPLKEGDPVTKGQLIARIKPTTFEAQYEAGIAGLNAAKARSEQSRASMLNAKAETERAEELKKKNLISDQEFQTVKLRYEVAEANFNAARFEIASSESQLKQLTESLRKTSVFSPMSGVLTSLISQLGEKVVGTSQFSGTEMMTISDLSVMNAEVEVDENDVVNVQIGDVARVSIDAFPNRVFNGTIIEIANSAMLRGQGSQDQSTNFAVKIRLNDINGTDLRPGMSCTAKIETETKTNVVAVPMMAVTRRESFSAKDTTKGAVGVDTTEAPMIVFVNDNGKAKAVAVTPGISDNAYVEIISGLKGDEEVIKGNYRAVSKELEDKKLIKVENKKPGAKADGEKEASVSVSF